MELVQALIVEKLILGPGYYRYDLLAPAIAAVARPGQFIEVKAAENGSADPILARPLSIYRIDPDAGVISILFKEVGRGTRMIGTKQTGHLITVFGPIGNGFTLPEARSVGLVGGGIGMPPLYGLAKACPGSQYTLFYGARSRKDLLELNSWSELGIPVRTATEDGSTGYHGLITDVLAKALSAGTVDYLVACGPKPMLAAVQKLAEAYGIPGELSLEAYMACGVGACLGCTCMTTHGYQRVCVDGPVFKIGEVNF